jgi:prophage tail gpP-like protein
MSGFLPAGASAADKALAQAALNRAAEGRAIPADDVPTITLDGKTYGGWTDLRVSRGLDRCATDFDLQVTERWLGQAVALPIKPFSECVVSLGKDPVLTGYVDAYSPAFDGNSHSVKIRGRSRTADLIDCTPDIESGKFAGYTLEAIVRAVCALFEIEVVVETDGAKGVVADATLERCETAWTFLERLCRLAGVLACDDAQGRLVLTRAGAERANGRLLQGDNILRAHARINVAKRFSDYIVKGQHGVGGAKNGALDLSSLAGPGPSVFAGKTGTVQTDQHASAHDAGVPRYRPHVSLAESQLTQAQTVLRANWQRAYGYGRSIQIHLSLAGWRQPNGSLWVLNQLVPVTSAYLGIDADMLVASVEYRLDAGTGRTTQLMLGPVEGYTPDPGEVKLKKHKHGKGGVAIDLHGLAAP